MMNDYLYNGLGHFHFYICNSSIVDGCRHRFDQPINRLLMMVVARSLDRSVFIIAIWCEVKV